MFAIVVSLWGNVLNFSPCMNGSVMKADKKFSSPHNQALSLPQYIACPCCTATHSITIHNMRGHKVTYIQVMTHVYVAIIVIASQATTHNGPHDLELQSCASG